MLLIMCLSLIAKITSVTCNCDVGISEVQNFDWYEVGAGVIIRFLKRVGLKLPHVFIFHL